MSTANAYDVELAVSNPNTGERTIVTRREYAYNALDAVVQAVTNAAADAGSAEVKALRVGPPEKAYRQAMDDLAEEVIRAVQRCAPRREGGG